jgi:hypothetical protein
MPTKNNDHYLGNPLIKAANTPVEFTPEQIEEYMKCANDPVYFVENYIKIVHVDRGLIPFEMYPFQENIVRTIHSNRFTICKLPRQSGKSTTMISYLLHHVLFNQDKKVAILANKLTTARELLQRLKKSYENLPKWLQQGIVEWNKLSIHLENGSKVIASSTSSSAVRGDTYSIILLDEFAFVPNNIAEDFFNSVYPTISSGKSTKVVVVSTPKGMNMFYKMWKNAEKDKNSYVPIEVHWNEIPGRDQKFKEETIRNTSERQWMQEFECTFLGSEDTLISSAKLATMVFDDPVKNSTEGLDIFEEPKKDRIYIMCIDTCRAQGADYHAFTVVDVTEMPYRVVAKFRNNEMPVLVYPTLIQKIGKYYNEAHVLVEINDVGSEVADILYQEMEYENVLLVSNRGKKGQKVDGGFGESGKVQYGVRTSYQIKKLGCSILKEMIEQDKLLIPDLDIISEFSTFISKGVSYEASEGYHDDLVDTLVLFSWLTTQSYFREIIDIDTRKKLYEKRIHDLEQSLSPFGFIEDGIVDYEDQRTQDALNLSREGSSRNKIENLPSEKDMEDDQSFFWS